MRLLMMWFFFALCVFSQLPSPWGAGSAAGVGGASNLTTVGAIPYVSASGVLNQTANLSFDVANNRLVLGSATVQRFSTDLSLSRASAGVLQVGDGGSNANGQVSARAVNAVSSLAAFNSTGGIYMSGNAGSSWGTIQSYSDGSGTAKATAINPTGGNLLIGTTTDSNFKLDVAASGSAGTMRVYGGSGVSDTTKVVVRAGAGQSTTNLTEWQDSSGTIVAQFKSSDARLTMGGFTGGSYQSSFRAIDFESWYGAQSPFTGSVSGRAMIIGGNAAGLRVASDYGMYWSANAAGSGDAYGSLDTGLSRNAAGVIEVNNGTAGTYRDIRVRDLITTLATPASSTAACAAGTWEADADYIYICTSTNNWKRVALTTF